MCSHRPRASPCERGAPGSHSSASDCFLCLSVWQPLLSICVFPPLRFEGNNLLICSRLVLSQSWSQRPFRSWVSKFPERWGSPGCHSPPFSKKPRLLRWLYKFLFMLASSLNKSPLPVARPLLFILCSPGGGGYCGSPPCQLEPKILSLTLTLAHPPWVRLSSCPCIRCGVYSHVLLCVAPGLALSILTRGWSSSRLPSLPLPAQILLLVTVVGWMMTL